MSRGLDVSVMNIDIFSRSAYLKRYKVFLLMNLAYLASRYTFIHVYRRSYFLRGLFDEIEGAISRVIAFLTSTVPLGLLNR